MHVSLSLLTTEHMCGRVQSETSFEFFTPPRDDSRPRGFMTRAQIRSHARAKCDRKQHMHNFIYFINVAHIYGILYTRSNIRTRIMLEYVVCCICWILRKMSARDFVRSVCRYGCGTVAGRGIKMAKRQLITPRQQWPASLVDQRLTPNAHSLESTLCSMWGCGSVQFCFWSQLSDQRRHICQAHVG